MPTYSFIDLDTLPNGNGYTVAVGINNLGQVVGESNVGNVSSQTYSDWHAFVYTPANGNSPSSMVDLGILPGSNYSFAQTINDSGEVVGYSSIGSVGNIDTAPANTHFRAVAWTQAGIQDLGSLPGTPDRSFGYGINNSGQLVGTSRNASNVSRATLFAIGSAPVDKGSPAGGATALSDINNSSIACGYSLGIGGAKAFRYNLSNDQVELLPDLPSGADSYGDAINDSGVVVGTGGAADSNYHATAWNGAAITDLTTGQTLPSGHIYSEALAINNLGVIVGFSTTDPNANYYQDPNQRAFIHRNGLLVDLNAITALPSGYVLKTATGINDHGQITGFAKTADGKRRAYLISPPALQLSGAVSRKTHGAGGPNFDIPMPVATPFGIECRTRGANGDHTLIFTFNNDIVSGNATVDSGTGSVTGSPTFFANTMTVNLTGVANAQTLLITLRSVTDSFGQVLPDTSIQAGFLLGDTTGDGNVNSGDIAQTKSQSGASVTTSNFREDVTVDGFINSGDIALVKSKSGTGLLP